MPIKRRKFLALVGLSAFGGKFLHNETLTHRLAIADPANQLSAPASKQSLLKFVVVGDGGTGEQSQYDVAQSMLRFHQQHPYSLVLLAGDNIYEGGEIHKISHVFEQPYSGLLQPQVKFHAVLGNHDVAFNQGQDQIRYPRFNMQGRYYTFSRGPVQFFALDTNPGKHLSAQFQWLESTLAQSQADWKIVLGHHPIYASGLHSIKQQLAQHLGPLLGQTKVYPGRLGQLPPLFAKHKVDLYINGHEHHYERTYAIAGTTYLTCGIGARLRPTGSSSWTAFASSQLGFAAIEVFEDRLVISGIGVNGDRFDQGTIVRQSSPKSDRKTSQGFK